MLYTSVSFRIFSNVNTVGKTHKNYRGREIHNNCHLGIFHSFNSLSLVPALTAMLAVAQLYCIFRILPCSSIFKQICPRLRHFYVAPSAIAFLQRTLTPFSLTFYLEKPLTPEEFWKVCLQFFILYRKSKSLQLQFKYLYFNSRKCSKYKR